MLLIFLALLPAVYLAVWIYKQDRVESEPMGLLLKIFLFGALSTIPTMILELALETIFSIFLDESSMAFLVLDNFIGVALIEEYCKMKAVKITAWKNPAFNYKFDAIVYCVMSALGFAALENIFYVIESGIGTAIMRALLSVPSHAIDGLIMGYFFGVAKEAELTGNRKRYKKYLFLSILMPTVEHGIYDASLSMENDWFLLFFFVFVIFVDIWAYKFVKKQSKKDMVMPR